MSEKFLDKKRRILQHLTKPEDEYTDASPKGSVDDGIRDLVEEINRESGYVTTSSCAGRVAVFLEGAAKPQAKSDNEGLLATTSESRQAITTKTGGKGGGRWLFVSHEPVGTERLVGDGAVYELLGLPTDNHVSYPQPDTASQFIHLKFEPMILHILTSNLKEAQAALNAAMAAGFRESGISGVSDGKGGSSAPMVAVRSSGLAFDSIIAFKSAKEDSDIKLMVSEAYLQTLIRVANDRFKVNAERKERFRLAFQEQCGAGRIPVQASATSGSPAYEPADVRRERKRREGLLRSEELRASRKVTNGLHGASAEAGSRDDENLDLNPFVDEPKQL